MAWGEHIRVGSVSRRTAARRTPRALGAAAVVAGILVAAAGAPSAALAQAQVRVEPAEAAPGASVRVTGTRFPPLTVVEIGAGPPRSDYDVIAERRTDANGVIRHTVPLATTAEPGTEIVFVIATEDLALSAASDPVRVISAPGTPMALLQAKTPAR